MSIGRRTAPLSPPHGLEKAVVVARRGPAEGLTWPRRFLLIGLFLLGLWALIAASADAAQADPADVGEPVVTWPPDSDSLVPEPPGPDLTGSPPPLDVVVPPDVLPTDPPADEGGPTPPPAEPSDPPPLAPDPPAVVPPDPPVVIVEAVVAVVEAVTDAVAPPSPVDASATDLLMASAGEPTDEVVVVVPAPAIAVPAVPVDAGQIQTSGPVQSSVPTAPCAPSLSGVGGPRSPAGWAAPFMRSGIEVAGGPSTAAGLGAPDQPLVPVAPRPLQLPVQAPFLPGGPSSATASGSSSCGTGHTQHADLALAVVDAGPAAPPAGSSMRPTSGFAGAVAGGAHDPGDRPD